MSSVLDAARAWLAQDPDAETRGELTDLISRVETGDAEASADLDDPFVLPLFVFIPTVLGTMFQQSGGVPKAKPAGGPGGVPAKK